MENISLDELKKIELDILVYIDEVCKENNLNYSLCGGTLLGAVRHKGFIPWDDDIDIMMPRPDYERFLEIVNRANGRYRALYSNQKDYYYTFAKIVDSETVLDEYRYQPIENMGVYVDVFPLEGMPSDGDAREKHFNELDRLRKRINSFSFLKPKIRKNLIAYVKTLCLYLINKKASLSEFQKEYETLAKKYNFYDSDYTYMTGGAYPEKEMFSCSVLSGYEKRVFEEREFSAIKEYDSYLKQLYRDYMKLPPKDKQITHHFFTAKHRI